MFRPIFAAGSMALALAVSPAIAQQSPAPEPPAAEKLDASAVGLSIFSSDGQKLGQVSEVGVSGGELAVRADLDDLMGKDSGSVIIRAKALARKADRIEIAMTAEQVRDTISKQRKEREKP
jgi:hypothetical protein